MDVDSFDFESELPELWKNFEATVPSLKAQIDDDNAQQQREDAALIDAAAASCEKLNQLVAQFNTAVEELRGRIESLESLLIHVQDPAGGDHIFRTQQDADRFKSEAGIQ